MIASSINRLLIVALLVMLNLHTIAPTRAHAGDASNIVTILKAEYGAVCDAKIEGWLSKTLKIDWTARTNKLHALKVLAEISSVKEKLYNDGVRYLKFPNDSGGYNVIDWKTGEKTSVSERAPYYF